MKKLEQFKFDKYRSSEFHYETIDAFNDGFDVATNHWLSIIEPLIQALSTAHEEACSCCDSNDLVREHCQKAIDNYKKELE